MGGKVVVISQAEAGPGEANLNLLPQVLVPGLALLLGGLLILHVRFKGPSPGQHLPPVSGSSSSSF